MGSNNLIPAQEGEIRNPKGRGKGALNRGTLINKYLDANSKGKNPISGEMENLSQEEWILIAVIAKARKGDMKAVEFLFDGKYGPLLKMAKEPDGNGNDDPFAPFTIVDPANQNEITDLEIGGAE